MFFIIINLEKEHGGFAASLKIDQNLNGLTPQKYIDALPKPDLDGAHLSEPPNYRLGSKVSFLILQIRCMCIAIKHKARYCFLYTFDFSFQLDRFLVKLL